MATEFFRQLAAKVPVPRSLLGRMLLLTLLAVLFAQALSSVIWVSQLRATQLEGLVTSARSLAHSMTASVSYFRSLPVAFRPLVLDQLRSMGGTRFVVTSTISPWAWKCCRLPRAKRQCSKRLTKCCASPWARTRISR